MPTPQEIEEAVSAATAEIEAQEIKPKPAEAAPAEPEPDKTAAEPEKPKEPEAEPEANAEKPKARRTEFIPAPKFHEVRHELQTAKQENKELRDRLAAIEAGKSAAPQSEEDINQMAEKYDLKPEVIADLVSLAAKRATPAAPKDLEERLAKIEAERLKAEDEARYRSEQDDVLNRFPELKPYSKDLKQLAYSQGNESVPLEYLALKLRHDLNLTEAVAPAEGASAPPAGKVRDYDNLSEEDVAKLSGEELDRYIAKNRLKR